jgi:hypothetical protein
MPVDINCDMGEGMGNDEQIMPFITSANIACGYHAGDISTMQKTIELCLKHDVAIGAHPSFFDRQNFGRTAIQLSAEEIYELIIQQLLILTEVANAFNTKVHHVKPHGALYNQSAKESSIATIIAKAVKDFDNQLILYGLSGSESIKQAQATGIKTASEVFADRSYQGRSHHGKGSGVVRGRFLGEIIGIFAHYLVLTVITGDFDREILVDIEGQGLIRDVFQGIHQDFSGNTHFTTVFGFDIQLHTHHGLQVGGYHGELVFFHFKEEIFQDRQYGIGVDYTGNML